ncbi:hypothetical protein EDD86DRAFT_87175 [Gorgonomyces haynaldii]|nr:hypothetical protein EDD86DRAFT_87175 [Gorgonomyces haynaldii]
MIPSKIGYVIGTKMQKTVKVRVEKIKIHPIIQKPVRYHKTFFAHDEEEKCVVGDFVQIDHCKKLSKMKNFTVGKILVPAQRVTDEHGTLHTARDEDKVNQLLSMEDMKKTFEKYAFETK